MSEKLPKYPILLLLLALDLSLASWLAPLAPAWTRHSDAPGDLMTIIFGDARRMFANHFFTQADIYFHAGYYPSIFDQQARPKDTSHMTEKHEDHECEEHDHEHEKAMDFLGKPKDWIDAFGRNFFVTKHTHIHGGTEREILPWLRISASLDPHRIETYTVAAFWLRSLGKAKEAETFLREGLRANPDSCEIIFELGRIYYQDYKDFARARNIFQLALKKWTAQNPGPLSKDNDNDRAALFQFEQIMTHLARLEEDQGNYALAADYLQQLIDRDATPSPEIIRQQIMELKEKASMSPRPQ